MNKKYGCLAFSLLLAAFAAHAQSEIIKLDASISWYGADFHGRPTSSGEIFDMNAMTAAHKTLPFGTMLEVVNLDNKKKAVVRVNDRGPFVDDRELDVSKAAAEQLGIIESGLGRASIRKIGAESAVAAVEQKAVEPKSADPEPLSKESREKLSTPAEAAPKAASGSVTWRIQLGSFSREENATRLVVRLREAGFDPAFEKFGEMTRVVLAGVQNAQLDDVKARLKKAGYGDWIVKQESW
ncbi:MAG: septal ring lytic transglycosylase RlpA family protein [Spirochaetales bacterium]|nr:septal ring lytic transglycosylase RlpA family protein [Spirochaetales bacterium]